MNSEVSPIIVESDKYPNTDVVNESFDIPTTCEESEEEKISITADYSSSEEQFPPEDPSLTPSDNNKSDSDSSDNSAPASPVPEIVRQKKHNYIVKVPHSHTKYNIKPKIIGDAKKILFEDAQNDSFYKERKLKNPELIVWLLLTSTNKLSYSARRMFEAGWKRNIQVMFMQTNLFDIIVSQSGFESLFYKGSKIEKLPDAVLPRIGAGIDYFQMALVRFLENNSVLVLNNHRSLMISRDKLYTLETLATRGVPIPKTMIAKFQPVVATPYSTNTKEGGSSGAAQHKAEKSPYDYVYREFTFPLILKKTSGSQGKGTIKLDSRQQLEDVCDMVDTKNPMIFQEFISNSSGRDIRVIVIGGKPIGAMMRIGKTGSFKSNFHQGGCCKKVELSPALEWLAIEVANTVGLEVAGIDILIGDKSYYICEVNASPGFEGFEQATGINVADHIMSYAYIKSGFWKNQKLSSRKSEKNMVTIPVQIQKEFV